MNVRGSTRVLAVLGDPVAHSVSPEMHNAAIRALGLDAIYIPVRVPVIALENALRAFGASDICGNATVPLKLPLFALLTERTPVCDRVGACNTFWWENGKLLGDNTDVAGVIGALTQLGVNDGGTWLVLGTGGAARAVAIAAAERGAELAVRSRDPARAQKLAAWANEQGVRARVANALEKRAVVVNATVLGLREDDRLPIEPAALPECRAALDLVYGPGRTRWVAAMSERGVPAADGRTMLVAQGAAAFERFFSGVTVPREVMHWAVERALRP